MSRLNIAIPLLFIILGWAIILNIISDHSLYPDGTPLGFCFLLGFPVFLLSHATFKALTGKSFSEMWDEIK